MGNPTAFLEIGRRKPAYRPAAERVRDFREIAQALPERDLREQASRCMDCGVPFCHQGCPLGNVIPEWNDLTYHGRWHEASDALHATNNFPEFTGHLCPAPCEEACVLNLPGEPVTIRQIEDQIVDRAFDEGWIVPSPAPRTTGFRVAVVGSGPAGLAAAQQLARIGHAVTVFERSDRVGGMLRYGIPDFKLEKWRIDRRIAQMEAEGVSFRTGVDVGTDLPAHALRNDFDAVCLAAGARQPRDLPVPGRALGGIHFAMDYLERANRTTAGLPVSDPIVAEGRNVVILGGGDTGADCLGTAHRQNARSVWQLELLPRPPDVRAESTPWPAWPLVMRSSAAHEEGGQRDFAVCTQAFVGDDRGHVRALRAIRLAWHERADGVREMREIPGSEFEIETDLVLLALGFTGVEPTALLDTLGVDRTTRGAIRTDDRYATGTPGVFACGDARRGASLIVWAIREGREAAHAIDTWLTAPR